jgi:hypothetical protein
MRTPSRRLLPCAAGKLQGTGAARFSHVGTVVIDVIDEFCRRNAGCWRIGSDGVERTDEAPGLRCDISALGSVYLGGFTWTQPRGRTAITTTRQPGAGLLMPCIRRTARADAPSLLSAPQLDLKSAPMQQAVRPSLAAIVRRQQIDP